MFSELLSIFPLLRWPSSRGGSRALGEGGTSEMGALFTTLEWGIRGGRGSDRHKGQSGHGLQTMENSLGMGKRETWLRNIDLRLGISGKRKTMTFLLRHQSP